MTSDKWNEAPRKGAVPALCLSRNHWDKVHVEQTVLESCMIEKCPRTTHKPSRLQTERGWTEIDLGFPESAWNGALEAYLKAKAEAVRAQSNSAQAFLTSDEMRLSSWGL